MMHRPAFGGATWAVFAPFASAGASAHCLARWAARFVLMRYYDPALVCLTSPEMASFSIPASSPEQNPHN